MSNRHPRLPERVRQQQRRISGRLRRIQGDRSQNQWATDTKVPQQNLSRYLNGTVPRVDFLIHLGNRGVDLNWLLLGVGEPYRGDETR